MAATMRNIINIFNKYTEIFIAFGIIAIIGIIIIPIPSGFLDFLLVCNISLGVIVLLLTLFTKNVLEFSTFPTLLLIATMFRLALNISSTRLILGDGDAGQVIDAFANFVTGNNYIVGAVVFIIIVIVQMVVVTNGAGRVSEVTARFTLDAMPGKQMAIDADLNAGLIDEESAKLRRKNLEREANFYGAMDGASKFVKGDAIAGIIITLVNLVGGILIFTMRDGIGIMDALDKFGKLTIGDGLVGQVPALLISIASGILVTRSDDGQSFGTSVVGELFGVSQVMIISAAVLFLRASGGENVATPMDLSMTTVVPAFAISELKTAFSIGFVIYLPFLVIDMVVASILMSMGMMMLPPVMISLPFKILLFVLVDGWYLMVESLLNSFL